MFEKATTGSHPTLTLQKNIHTHYTRKRGCEDLNPYTYTRWGSVLGECVFSNVKFTGTTLHKYQGIPTWHRCQDLCKGYEGGKFWSHVGETCSVFGEPDGNFARSQENGATSGEINCGT